LAPAWKEFHNLAKDTVNVIKIDCTENDSKAICSTFGVSGYPTLFFLKDTVAYKYATGPRTLKAFNFFADGGYETTDKDNTFEIPAKGSVMKKQEKAQKEREAADPNMPQDISYEDFGKKVFESIKDEDGKVKNLKVIGEKPWFIMFHSPSCGHCKKFKPTWKDFNVKHNDTVNVGMIDCKGDTTAELCKKMSVRGYPTLLFFEGDMQYSFKGDRSLEKLGEFVNGGYKSEKIDHR